MGKFVNSIAELQNLQEYADLHWSGTFEDYIDIVRKNPKVTRTAYQRLYDMVLSWGTSEAVDNKKKIVHYNFFDDPLSNGKDAVFGLDIPLMRLVNVFKSAAMGYGAEKRVILLHGPVGSSKSTIARLLKRGMEALQPHGRGRALHLRVARPRGAAAHHRWRAIFPSP
jgi:serine protein kinase